MKGDRTGDVRQHDRIRLIPDFDREIQHLKDALKADHTGGELDMGIADGT